jgi:hypothetical protein
MDGLSVGLIQNKGEGGGRLSKGFRGNVVSLLRGINPNLDRIINIAPRDKHSMTYRFTAIRIIVICLSVVL